MAKKKCKYVLKSDLLPVGSLNKQKFVSFFFFHRFWNRFRVDFERIFVHIGAVSASFFQA